MTNIKDKPGGRPAKKRIEKQQRVVSTKLTELQYYAIRKRAGEAGLRVSEYVRQAVVSAEVIPRLNRQDADTIRKLAGEANNINQLAHRANAGGFALVAVELVKLKNRIIEIRKGPRRHAPGAGRAVRARLYRGVLPSAAYAGGNSCPEYR